MLQVILATIAQLLVFILYLFIVFGIIPLALYNPTILINDFTIFFIPALYLILSLIIINYFKKIQKTKAFIITYTISSFIGTIFTFVIMIAAYNGYHG